MDDKQVVVVNSKNTTLVHSQRDAKKKPKIKATVLDEDVYLEKLDKIIQRDFFPDIVKLKAQNEYFDAVQNNDQAKIKQLQEKFSSRRTDKPINTPRSPAFFETPIGSREADDWETSEKLESAAADSLKNSRKQTGAQVVNAPPDASGQNVEIDAVGVDKFLQKYTSEDNASFEEILEKNEAKMRQKFDWMYKAEIKHEKMFKESLAVRQADEQAVLAIEEANPGAKKTPKRASVDNWTYKALNSVMFVPTGEEFTPEEMVERHKMLGRVIRHENTRLPNIFDPCTSAQAMQKAATLQAASNKGRVDAQGNEVAPGGAFGQFSFVATPSPAPVDATRLALNCVTESPFMTWGEIEGTPFCLDASDSLMHRTPGPSFKIPDVPLRDKLANSMVSELTKSKKEKKLAALHGIKSLTPKFGSIKSNERLDSMSPAAKRLATSKLGIRLSSDKTLKASYTPSPVRKSTKTPLVDYETPQLGNVPTSMRSARAENTDESLTDNLLNLHSSKKPSATDYF